MNKWNQVKQQVLQEEKQAQEEFTGLGMKRREAEKLARWKAEMEAGDASANANFIHVGSDWRERVAKRRREIMGETRQETE